MMLSFLFLLNPNGILFGPNAQLSIDGSFLATTANRINFADGTEFSTTNIATPALLTVSVPIGLQTGPQANPIINQTQTPTGLEVTPGQTLALLGGDIQIQGGQLKAIDGRIEIGSIGPNSIVQLNPANPGWSLSYNGVSRFQAIELNNGATVSTSGNSGGNVQIQGQIISLQNNSRVMANTEGTGNGGDLVLRASERVDIVGNYSFEPYPTGLFANLRPEAIGNSGNLLIETKDLTVSQSAVVSTERFGAGNGGDLTMRAEQINVLGNPDGTGFPTIISSQVSGEGLGRGGNVNIFAQELHAKDWLIITADTAGAGNSGNMLIQVDRLKLQDGAQVGSGTFAGGDGGTVTVNASESIEVSGYKTFSLGNFSSGLFASAESAATGNGSDINITTGKLQVFNGGKIAANAVGTGRAGNIKIKAQEIEVADPVVDFTGAISGLVVSAVGQNSAGGGDIQIDTDRLRVFRGGQITAESSGSGKAGDIFINSKSIEITGKSQDGLTPSRITAQANSDVNAGSVNIVSKDFAVRDQAEVSVSNLGNGNAGNLNLSSNSIRLSNFGRLTAQVNAGDQGNIDINANLLVLDKNSNITTNAGQMANGGNINIASSLIIGLDNSDIVANAFQGQGGNIQITTQGILGLKSRPKLTSESDITASSEFGLSGSVAVNNFGTNPDPGLVALPIDLLDGSQQLSSGCKSNQGNRFVVTGRGGLPNDPNHNHSYRAWQDMGSLNGLYPQQTKISAVTANQHLTEATTWNKSSLGEVTLLAQLPQTKDIAAQATCAKP